MNETEKENFALTLMDQIERDISRLAGTIKQVYGWNTVQVTRPLNRKVVLITGWHAAPQTGEHLPTTFMVSVADLGAYYPIPAGTPGDYGMILG